MSRREAACDGLLGVVAALLQLAVASFVLGALAAGPLLASRLRPAVGAVSGLHAAPPPLWRVVLGDFLLGLTGGLVLPLVARLVSLVRRAGCARVG
jgi:hypothetical protein